MIFTSIGVSPPLVTQQTRLDYHKSLQTSKTLSLIVQLTFPHTLDMATH